MGTDYFTIRKRKQKIKVAGEVVEARMFLYAYRPRTSWFQGDEGVRARVDNCAEKAYEDYLDNGGGLVIVACEHQGVKSLDGAYVYRDVKTSHWHDCNKFPGEPVGIAQVDGRGLKLVKEWSNSSGMTWRLVDGKFEMRSKVPA
ncbi:MAG: hypothetical protein ACYS7Y_04090 [Planctomycetota bacterium]|jgi:hypothetical protein